MSYLINLSKFLQKKNIKTTLLGAGVFSGNDKTNLFSNVINISPQINTSNYQYLLQLFKRLPGLNLNKNIIIHAQRPDMIIPAVLRFQHNYLVVSLHGAHDLAVYDKKGFLQGIIYSFLQSIAFLAVDRFIAVDEATKQHYIKLYPWAKNKIKMIPIAVCTDKFHPMDKGLLRDEHSLDRNDKIIVFVGRIEKEKNIQMLIDSFRIIKKNIVNAKLIIVGEGKEKQKMIDMAKQMQIEDVIFLGEVSNDNIPKILNCADVFAFCSLYEGSPTVIKEALACNLPIVSVDVGDVKTVIGDIEGCYIAERNIVDFSVKLMRVLNSEISFNGRKKALLFRNDRIGQKTLDTYKEIVGDSCG